MKVITYIKESFEELRTKVTWPTWSELQGSSIIVLVASLMIAVVVFGMDTVFNETLKLLYSTLS